jgi:hypothetical protein
MVISTSVKLLNQNRNIYEIFLGVHAKNLAAIKAYQNLGLVITNTTQINSKNTEVLAMKLSMMHE